MTQRKVLLVLAGWFHPPYQGRVWLREALAQLGHFSFDQVATLAQAVMRPLSSYDAMVLYYHHRNVALSTAELEAFRSFVTGGGGVLAVHSATASYKPTPGYFEILGGRFVGHGRVEQLEINRTHERDAIFSDIPAFLVTDELYLHDLQPDITVHFHAEHEGKPTPVVWTRTVGNGRVCYVCPGHRAASMRNPTLQAVLQRGMRWVTNEI